MSAAALDKTILESTAAVLLECLPEPGRGRALAGTGHLALQLALARTFNSFVRHWPQWAGHLFDPAFLSGPGAAILARCLGGGPPPDPTELAAASASSSGAPETERERWLTSVLPAAAELLRLFRAELDSQPELRSLLGAADAALRPERRDRGAASPDGSALPRMASPDGAGSIQRDLETALERSAGYQVTVSQAKGCAFGEAASVTNIYQTFYSGLDASLADLQLPSQDVFKRVRAEEFVGRRELEADLDAFLNDAERDRGAWVLVGEAGIGKTAFLAHLVRERGYIHLFSEQAPGDASLSRASQSLAAQLISRFRIDPYFQRDGLPLSLIQAPDFWTAMLRRAAEQLGAGERLVLVLDALDEAGTAPGGNVLGLPRQLPKGVFLILSQRPEPVKLTLEPSPRRVDLKAESEENERDIAEYLCRISAVPSIRDQLLARRYTVEQFVQALAQKSAGNWMYLHYVVDEIRDGKRAPLDLNALPPGLVGYYAQYWSRWREKPEWDALYAPLLATLGAAFEPRTAAELIRWSGVTASLYQVERLLREEWRAFVFVLDGTERRFRPYHASLRDFLAGRAETAQLLPEQQYLVDELRERTREAHLRIANDFSGRYGGCWPELAADAYARRFLSAHLRLGGDRSTLFALMDDPAWYEAQQHFDPSHAAFLNDVRQAWTAAEEVDRAACERGEAAPLLGREIRCALVTSSIHSLSRSVPPELLLALVQAELWSAEQAFRVVRNNPVYEERGAALCLLAPYLPANLVGEAVAFAEALVFPSDIAIGLPALALRVAEPLRGNLQNRALAAAALLLPDDWFHLLESRRLPQPNEPLHKEFANLVLAVLLDKGNAPIDLERLTRHLGWFPESLRDLALDHGLMTARATRDLYQKAKAFVSLLPYLSDKKKTEAVEQSLRAARALQRASSRGEILAGLLPYAREPARERLAHEALALVSAIGLPALRARILSSEEARVGASLAADLLRQAVDLALTVPAPGERLELLMDLISKVEEPCRSRLWNAVRSTSRDISSGYVQLDEIKYYASLVPKSCVEEALDGVLNAEISMAVRLAWIAALVPRLPKTRLGHALSSTLAINDNEARCAALIALGRHCPISFREAALDFAKECGVDEPWGVGMLLLAACLFEEPRCSELQNTVESLAKMAGGIDISPVMIQYRINNIHLSVFEHLIRGWLGICFNESVYDILPHLTVDMVERLLEKVYELSPTDDVADIMIQCADKISELRMEQALDIAEDAMYGDKGIELLRAITPYLPDYLVMRAVEFAPDVRELDRVERGADWWSELIPYVPEAVLDDIRAEMEDLQGASKISLLLALAKRSKPADRQGLLDEADWLAHVQSTDYLRAASLVQVTPLLPSERIEKVGGEALKAIERICDPEDRLSLLIELAPSLPEHLLLHALPRVTAGTMLSLRWRSASEEQQAELFKHLAPHLSERGLREVLAATRQFRSAEARLVVLRSFSQHISGTLRAEALDAALNINSSKLRTLALAALARGMTSDNDSRLYSVWLPLLSSIARRSREDFLEVISDHLSIIIALGGEEAVKESFSAIQEVGNRWP